jgi:capsular polysaccharide biosynthesis protein
MIMNSNRPRTLTDYIRAARRRKSIIILTAVVFIFAAGLSLKRAANAYESTASIIIEMPSSIDPARRVKVLEQQVTNRARLEAIVTGNDAFKREIEKGARMDDLISQARASITVAEDANGENQFALSFRAADPETAQKITAELADQLIEENSKPLQAQSTSGEAETLRQRAVEISSQLHQLEEKAPWLLTVSEAAPIAPATPVERISQASAEAIRAQQMTIESLKDRQYLIQQQLADLERRIESQRQLIEQQKKSSSLRDNPTYAVLISKRAELQGQRDTLINRQELTDKHPRVTAIADQINAINRQIEELRQQDAGLVSQSPETRELASLESERNRLKLELEINSRETARRMSSSPVRAVSHAPAANPAQRDGASARLAQQYLALKHDHEELISRAQDEESKRQPVTAAQAAQVRLVERATLPHQPTGPGRLLLMLAALAVGLAAGACFAVLAEARRFTSLQDARDVQHYTRVPLLAAIPRSLTVQEQEIAGRQAKVKLAISTVIATVATFALSEIFILTNIFALLGKK